jgi:Na+/proline symporter
LDIYFWTIVIYLLALTAVALKTSRGVSTQEDFSVAGRKLNAFVLFGTMLATWIGTGSIFGNAEKTYRVGISAFILPLGAIAGIGVLYFLAGRARGLRQITIQDLLEQRYNSAARLFGVIALVIAYITIVSYQYRAAGAVLNLTLPQVSYDDAVLISALFIIAYTALAGMVSIAYIGLIQGITMILGVVLALPVFYVNAGGFEGMSQALESSKFSLFGPIGWVEAVGLVLPPLLLVLGDANMYQRFFSARTEGVARKAVFWSLFGIAFMELAIIVTAWVASALEPGLEVPGRVIAFAARDHLPVALGVLMLMTIMAIVLSTAGSYLLAPATAIVRDIYQRFIRPGASEKSLVRMLRIMVLVMGFLAYYLATLSDEFLSVALLAYTIYGAAITPPLIASFVWKRATAQGAVASIILGAVTTLVWKGWGPESIDAVIPAIAVSVLALVVVSLLTPPSPEEKVKPFFESPNPTV